MVEDLSEGLEIVDASFWSSDDTFVHFSDRTRAEMWLRSCKGNSLLMQRLRSVLVRTDHAIFRMSDQAVIQLIAWRLAAGQLLIRRRHAGLLTIPSAFHSSVDPQERREMSGYFTMMKYVLRSRSLEHLEDLVGFRRGRLSSNGLLIYRFLRLPDTSEFEVSGYSVTAKHVWDKDEAPKRAAELAAVADYHRNTNVPTFDEIQKRNAVQSMTLSGDNMLVKLYPADWQPIDDTDQGYPPGQGIPQWRLTDAKSRKVIPGKLLLNISAGAALPWAE